MSLEATNLCFTAESSPEILFQQLQQLVQQIIIPYTESLIPTLITRLEERREVVNGKDNESWVDFKSRLNDSEKAIIDRFIIALTQDCAGHSVSDQGSITLELMDNDDLDQRLLWLNAANLFKDSENYQRIGQINSCLSSHFQQYEGTLPATPEQLCESFFTAIAPLSPDKNIVQQLFIWFADHFKPVADELWHKTEQLLAKKQPAPEPSDKTSAKITDIKPTPTSTHQEQPATPHSETISPEFMDSLAAQLVSRVDNLLGDDDSKVKKQNDTVDKTDLVEILSSLQVDDQPTSPARLHDTIISSLAVKGITAKLSRQHEDRINAVGWLFHHVLEDENLPDDIARSIAPFQIPILQQAIVDDTFLANYQHPARRLLTVFTSSGSHCQEASLCDHVSMLIEHTVRTIIGNHDISLDFFQDCLEGFQSNLKEILPTQDAAQDGSSEPSAIADETVESDPVELLASATAQDTSGLTEEIILSSDAPVSSKETEAKPADSEPFEEGQEAPEQQETIPAEILHCGQWVEFIGQGDSHRLRCKLLRVSEDGQRYIFVNRSGMTVAQRSAIELQKSIEAGSVHILDDNPIIDRAIQAVLGRFKNSD